MSGRTPALAAALLIAVLGALAVLAMPPVLPKTTPFPTGHIPGMILPQGGGPADLPPLGVEPRRIQPVLQAIEQVSPIVDAQGILVESLGVEVPLGSFLRVLPKGTQTPAHRTLNYGTGPGGPPEIHLHVLRGNSDHPAEDHSLGWYRVAGLPELPPGKTRAVIVFRVADGAVLLAAMNPLNGDPLPILPWQPPAAPP
jgi:hypothetical protein